MSKNYKLIREYPGSPKLGTILPENGTTNGNIFYDKEANPHRLYIDKFPHFWQEIVEKEYEILSFIVNQSKGVLIIGDTVSKTNDSFKGTSSHNRGIIAGNSENEFLSKDHWSIHSVKRLSDGEIFTVGDKVNCWDGIKKIEMIYILNDSKNKLRFWMKGQYGIEGVSNNKNPSGYTLEHLQKAKQPLFTTEDGVDIFEGDSYWYINNMSTVHKTVAKYEGSNSLGLKLFSTKEKAEEYIIMNKPCLSLNDVYIAAHGMIKPHHVMGQHLRLLVEKRTRL